LASVTLALRRSVFVNDSSATSMLVSGMLVIAGITSALSSSPVLSGWTLWFDACNPFAGTGAFMLLGDLCMKRKV
jgi:hypothetical protein